MHSGSVSQIYQYGCKMVIKLTKTN